MAEQAKLLAPFPAPPPFYKHFTKQNLACLQQIQKEAASDAKDDAGHEAAALPTGLQYLVPPEVPSDGKYTSFGAAIDLDAPDPDLAAADVEQLYPAQTSVRLNPQPYLIALARSALTTFLALTGVLSQNPVQHEEQTKDLRTIMFNMHHLINYYRPHQARETLLLMMQDRVDTARGEIRAVDEAKAKVTRLLQGLRDAGVRQEAEEEKEEHAGRLQNETGRQESKERQRAAWRSLENGFS